MHFYPHNIADFNNATRHLTRVERSVYRDSIEMYYDTEQPLAGDVSLLARKLLCRSDEEKQALETVLAEFYTLVDGVYRHARCDIEIEKYRANSSAKARAGKASAEARQQKAKDKNEQKSTGAEHVLNVCGTGKQLTNNQEPITSNQEKDKEIGADAPKRKVFKPPTVEDVCDYLMDKAISGIDPVYFVDYYEARGWKISGGTKMADWKAVIRTWKNREEKAYAKNRPSGNPGASGRKPTPAERVRARHAEIYGSEAASESPVVGALVAVQ